MIFLVRHTGTSWALTGLVATTLWATAELWKAFLLARSALGSDVLNMVEVADQPDDVGESDEKGKTGFTRIPGLPRSVSDDRNSVALRTRLSRDFPALLESAGLVGQSHVPNYSRLRGLPKENS